MKSNIDQEIDNLQANFDWKKEELEPKETFVLKLEAQIKNQAKENQGKSSPSSSWKTSWQFAFAVFALIIIVIIAIKPVNVLAKVRELLGFNTSFGVVNSETNPRTISELASQTKDGVTVTVQEGLFTEDKTTLHYTIDGINNTKYAFDPREESCKSPEQLRLPDGTLISMQSPVPESVSSVDLILACIPGTKTGLVPEDWEIPLQITDNLALIPVYPLYDVSSTNITPDDSIENEPKAKMEVEIGKYVTTKDSIILIGVQVTTSPPDWSVTSTGDFIQDANGETIETTYPEGAAMGVDLNYGQNREYWATEFKTEGVAFPITITKKYRVFEPVDDEAEFTIDVGHDLEVGQIIEVNQPFKLGQDTIVLKTLTVYDNGYGFDYALGNQISTLYSNIKGYRAYGAGGMGFAAMKTDFYRDSLIFEERPEGEITIIVSHPHIGHEIEETSIQWSPN